ncbi:MAG: large conductance mechanosensitive channel protein MscL [Candidatus Tokpelaia sp.]|uniref:large conductance mechanosensitive channel protein MscL n=1 Tax=Candidatus Tokpelaia sp. TaxID=2233777 RepID=UPI00123A6237|nr:large conductance mechanosensitive channel protein MscL [Candidatus Tokpelaia sp.]KAA6205614.1 MAG: large conductance mechanosensitive channel protein MscL [Candidatus Tokpelaia sp.]KAA6206288.1 MAG: large conductance mechanosensitive channel protein MscL [Candidatus Tokpelaia sp.]KAA6406277.1 large conductance mechanosensitive channel protein MscL [Candidatus Tokpelaia sp.]
MLEEFKKFALRGNMIDLAVGVIVGAAFSGLVSSIVNDLFMPVLGLITGGLDFSNIFWQMVGTKQPTLDSARRMGATLAYGHFLTVLINFLIITFVLFITIKGLNKLSAGNKNAEADKKSKEAPLPAKTRTDMLLEEIRDIMRKENAATAKALKTDKKK